tara:strand:+ start:5553 stop:5690 length:138 start_codon:yes stop_codon:yes gene_type:complete
VEDACKGRGKKEAAQAASQGEIIQHHKMRGKNRGKGSYPKEEKRI